MGHPVIHHILRIIFVTQFLIVVHFRFIKYLPFFNMYECRFHTCRWLRCYGQFVLVIARCLEGKGNDEGELHTGHRRQDKVNINCLSSTFNTAINILTTTQKY